MFVATAQEMYDIDQYTMEEIAFEGKILMENAGRAVAEKVKSMVQPTDHITIIIGPGNNGGDGFVIARTLMESAYNINVVQAVPDEKIIGDARYHKNVWLNSGGEIKTILSPTELESVLQETDVIVDALFGIGVKADLREPLKSMVKKSMKSK
jgi:NAD(P)H-hydrate epimerase